MPTNRIVRQLFEKATSLHHKKQILDIYIKEKVDHACRKLPYIEIKHGMEKLKIIDFSKLGLRGLDISQFFNIPPVKGGHIYSYLTPYTDTPEMVSIPYINQYGRRIFC